MRDADVMPDTAEVVATLSQLRGDLVALCGDLVRSASHAAEVSQSNGDTRDGLTKTMFARSNVTVPSELWEHFVKTVDEAQQVPINHVQRFREWVLADSPLPVLVDLRECVDIGMPAKDGRRFVNPSIERDWKVWRASAGLTQG